MEREQLKSIIVAILAVVCASDTFTTVLGLYSIVKPVPGNELSWIICIGPALVILVLLLSTEFIWSDYGFMFNVMKFLWILGLIYDIYTSFVANLVIVAVGASALASLPVAQAWNTATSGQLGAVCFGTVLMTLSPMLLPYIVKHL